MVGEARTLLRREDAALIVVDVQEKLLPAIAAPEPLVANIVMLLRFAPIVGLPVILTEQEKLGGTVPPIQAELPDAVPLRKLHFSCFGSEDFAEAVRRSGRRTLILAGIEAHICVAQTALDAPPDYRVQVVADAVSSRRLSDRDLALRRLEQSGVILTSTEMLMYELLGCAGTDEFRAALALVKAAAAGSRSV
jgi:nicotinamidase-related amidase